MKRYLDEVSGKRYDMQIKYRKKISDFQILKEIIR